MAKQESIEVEGTIKEALPGARFRVTINLGGKEWSFSSCKRQNENALY